MSEPCMMETTVLTNPNPGVFLPTSTPFGESYGGWQARWWRRVIEIPRHVNPVLDPTGARGTIDQSGPVWFLYGVHHSGHVHRTVTVPEGKALLVPIITVLEGDLTSCVVPRTVEDLYEDAAFRIDSVTELEACVDDVPLTCLSLYRVVSPVFFGVLPHDNIVNVEVPQCARGLPFEAIADGYWALLEPLSSGHHTVCFHGEYENRHGRFSASVTYCLRIEPECPQECESKDAPEDVHVEEADGSPRRSGCA